MVECDLDVSNISVKIGNKIIVEDVSISIGKGKILAIMGSSGGGKSTLVRCINCQLKPYTGSGNVLGYDIITQKKKIQREIGYVPQQDFVNMYMELSALDNISYFAKAYGIKGKQQIFDVLKVLDIAPKIQKIPVKRLSGGERKRISIAMGIVHQPKLLILDEPTTGLDQHLKTVIFNYIKKLNQEKDITIILVSHNLLICEMADKALMMSEGKAVVQGNPNDLLRSLPSEGECIKIRFKWSEDVKERIALLRSLSFVEDFIPVGRNFYKFFCHKMDDGLDGFLEQIKGVGLKPLEIISDDATLLDYFLFRLKKNKGTEN